MRSSSLWCRGAVRLGLSGWGLGLTLGCHGVVLCTPAQAETTAAPEAVSPNSDLQHELEAMLASDQSERKRLQQVQAQYGLNSPQMKALWEKQTAIDQHNLKRLEAIIARYGWPGTSLVGKQGALAAFLILQHAELAPQKKYLPLVRAAVAQGELAVQHLALLEDRVRVREGQMQLYGTQLHSDAQGQFLLYPIEDEAHVDQRRAAMGLPPLAEYLKQFGLTYTPTGAQPQPLQPSEGGD